ncbi:hypothetical protein HZB02_01325 [Candidatus Woesearchaeota archaeon]|nr:hypothetical protein [Candidatus Woesearchaeota archaeon]
MDSLTDPFDLETDETLTSVTLAELVIQERVVYQGPFDSILRYAHYQLERPRQLLEQEDGLSLTFYVNKRTNPLFLCRSCFRQPGS